MSQIHSYAPVLPFAQPRAITQRVLRSVVVIGAGSLLMAAAAHVAVPFFFTPVPFTLQTLALLGIALLIEPSLAFATMIAYLAEGACGLPVFAPGTFGAAALLGPSAGFLWATPAAAFAASKLYRALGRSSFASALVAAACGAAFYFLGGAAWFAALFHSSLRVTLDMTVWPFLAGDSLKVVLAAALITGITRLRVRKSPQQA